MVIYFTGTGNSKYLAEVIAKKLNDTLVDARKPIKSGDFPTYESQTPYVFVAPTYSWRMPKIFEKWIEKCCFSGNNKAYFVLDCGGSIGVAGNYTKKLCNKMNFTYMGTSEILMPENYLIMFEPTPIEQDQEIIEKATLETEKLCEKILGGEPFDKVKGTFLGHLCSDMVAPMFNTFYLSAKKFYATDKCISCGKCVENCPLNTISLVEGKPVWKKECTHCLACICGCPTEAIEYGKSTKDRRRYMFSK